MASKDLVSEEVLQELTNKIQEIVNNYCWNLEYFTPTDIEGFFDGTQQEINYYSSLIKDDVVSKNFLHSSKQIADDIAQSILEANEYTDSLLKNISSIQLEWCETNLPTTGENNKIYILPVTSGSGSTIVNTLNIWNNTSNNWVSIGNLEIDITQFYNKTEIDTKMDLKANKTEVVENDKIVQTLGATTNSSDTILSTSGLQVEMDKKANDDEVIKKTSLVTSIDSSSKEDTVPSSKSVYDFKNYTIINYPDLKANNTITVFTDLVKLVPINKTWYIVNFKEDSLSTADAIEKFGFPTNMNAWGNIQITCKQRFDVYRSYYIELQTDGNSQFTYRWLGECTSVESQGVEAYTIKWKMLCSTNVADVGITNIKFTSTTNYKSSSKIPLKYTVSNGICYVSGGINCVSPSSSDAQVSTLPKPKAGYQYCKTMGVGSNATDTNTPLLLVGTDGELFLSKGVAKGEYRCTFSYPVAE